MMDRLSAMSIFVRVVDAGSFSAAARSTGLQQPAISKQIAALEAHLGAQLLRRTSRTLVLTEAGREFYEAAVRIVRDVATAEARVGQGQKTPVGLVRATVTPVFGRLFLVPRLPEFYRTYPDLAVELIVTDRLPNFLKEGVDLAIFHGPLSDSSYVTKKIAQSRPVTVASPDYLQANGEPTSPEQLIDHACVSYAPHGKPRAWTFIGDMGPAAYHPRASFRTNDADHIRAAALAGIGIAHAPAWLFASEISSGAVRPILSGYNPPSIAISTVRPAGQFLTNKVRAFMAFVSHILAEEPTLTLRNRETGLPERPLSDANR